MGRSALFVSLVLGALSTAGCASYVPFTQELRDQHHLAEGDLKNLQFYNSHTITLRREVQRGGGNVTPGHKLLVIAGKQIEEVVIEEHTPGVVVGASDDELRVSFAQGTFMTFSVRNGEAYYAQPVSNGRFAEPPPEPFPGNDPVRIEPSHRFGGSGNYWLMPTGGSVVFQGQSWDAIGQSSQAHLVISTESLEQVDESRTVLRGRKL